MLFAVSQILRWARHHPSRERQGLASGLLAAEPATHSALRPALLWEGFHGARVDPRATRLQANYDPAQPLKISPEAMGSHFW